METVRKLRFIFETFTWANLRILQALLQGLSGESSSLVIGHQSEKPPRTQRTTKEGHKEKFFVHLRALGGQDPPWAAQEPCAGMTLDRPIRLCPGTR